MKLVANPTLDLFADDLAKDQIITLPVEHYGQIRNVDFKVGIRWDGPGDSGDVRLVSVDYGIAYCMSGRGGGTRAWQCPLEIMVMSRASRASDAQYPARKTIKTWSLYSSTNRLNRNYPICGWWDKHCEANRSQHNSA